MFLYMLGPRVIPPLPYVHYRSSLWYEFVVFRGLHFLGKVSHGYLDVYVSCWSVPSGRQAAHTQRGNVIFTGVLHTGIVYNAPERFMHARYTLCIIRLVCCTLRLRGVQPTLGKVYIAADTYTYRLLHCDYDSLTSNVLSTYTFPE